MDEPYDNKIHLASSNRRVSNSRPRTEMKVSGNYNDTLLGRLERYTYKSEMDESDALRDALTSSPRSENAGSKVRESGGHGRNGLTSLSSGRVKHSRNEGGRIKNGGHLVSGTQSN